MITLTTKEIRKAIQNHIPVGVEMYSSSGVRTWLLEKVFDYDVWIRGDHCGIVVKAMAKQGFFSTYRTQTGTIVYVRN